MTRDEFLDQISLPPGAEIVEFHFTEQRTFDAVAGLEPVTHAAHVICGLLAPDQKTALAGAEAVIRVVDGKDTYVRVAPEAENRTAIF